MRILYFLLAGLTLAACAGPTVRISDRFSPRQVKTVAVLDFDDAPRFPGSGEIVAQAFLQELLERGFRVIERSRIDALLAERRLNAKDERAVQKIASELGVDAFVTGSVSTYLPERRTTTWVREADTNSTVVGSSNTARQRRSRTRETVTPLTNYESAELGIISRMVDVKTGEILWVGSYQSSGYNLQDVAQYVSDEIIREVLKRSQDRGK